jgi:holo-[acyl-carrier protein] synthase
MVLPVTTLDRKEHQSSRPQGLILHEALPEVNESENKAARATFDVEALDGQLCEISITHDGDFASAVALVPSMKQNGLP